MSGGQGKLWAFGDSFTFGSELKDAVDEFTYSENTWQALLAKDKGLKYKCIARGGVSNDWITRNIIKRLDQIDADKDYVIVQWTYFGRTEFKLDNFTDGSIDANGGKFQLYEDPSYFQTSPNLSDAIQGMDHNWAKNKLDNLKKSGALELNDIYYRRAYHNESAAFGFFKNIKLIQSVLQSKAYKFSFVSNESNRYIDHTNPMFKNISQFLDHERLIWFRDTNQQLGFNEWCAKQKFTRGPHNHPLEEAHQAAFKYIKETYNV